MMLIVDMRYATQKLNFMSVYCACFYTVSHDGDGKIKQVYTCNCKTILYDGPIHLCSH